MRKLIIMGVHVLNYETCHEKKLGELHYTGVTWELKWLNEFSHCGHVIISNSLDIIVVPDGDNAKQEGLGSLIENEDFALQLLDIMRRTHKWINV